ncbi:MAG: ABC transporter ATP-binding protein [Bacillota bacterium]|jgi:ATP-binding cassette subfamily B protein|nr:ABC transporter ATP-binding protein [Bacillota bacterium]HOC07036.1 ABC transporter ATP-binding protein [Bacillota bacterium]HPZ22808.1 ABC transporter ATP-binding protein [Bacillota bacterium]
MKELKALLPFAKPYKWWIVLATVCMIFVTAASLAGPWAIRNLIQTITAGVEEQGDLSRVTLLAVLVVVIYIIRAASKFGTDYISHYAAWNMVKEIRQKMYDRVQRMSLRYFSDKPTGELMSRVLNDTRNFEILFAHAIPTVLVNGVMLVGVFAILFSMSKALALYTLMPIPLLAWLVIRFNKISRPLFRKNQVKVAELNAVLQDNFSGIKEIKAFTQEEYESQRTGRSLQAQTKAILQALKVTNAFHPGIDFISGLGTIIVIFFGGRLALAGALPLEDLVAFLLYLNIFYQPITALGQINEGVQQALASAERVLEILDREPEIQEIAQPLVFDKVSGIVEFRNVSFSYVDNIPVLKDISFIVRPGETLALVGATGVGKTTIASLIPRFYDPDAGEILVDGVDIRKWALSSLRSQISLVSQDIFLFNGTVRDNIAYGLPDASEEEIIAASKAANAHEFIQALEKGYDTRIGERGVKLSGGQKQRISIARAILKDAPILILDEATSAVDTQTELLIQEALNKLKVNKTAVVIAHRLSTIQDADQIIVLKDGEIFEQGSHEELMASGSLYWQLCKAQSAAETMAG